MWNCASERNRFVFRIRGVTRCRVGIVVAMIRCLGPAKSPQRRYNVGVGRRKTTAVIYKMSSLGAPKENAGFCKNPVFINLLEHLFFFRQQNRE